MSSSLRLPDLTLPFPGECHPCIDDVERDANDWISTYVSDPSTLQHLEKARAGRIAGRTADPNAPVELLKSYARFLIWGFWFDDEFIDDCRADSRLQVPAVASVLDILDKGAGTGAAGAAMEAAFSTVVRDMHQVLCADQFARWCIEMRQWFTSMIMQNKLREHGVVPSVEAYKTVRIYTVCSFACIVLIDASRKESPGWDEYYNPDLAMLRMHAANVVAWQNDIFSFFSESHHPGSFWNLPSVYMAHGASTQEALDRTAQDAADEVGAFTARMASVRTATKRQHSHVQTLMSWMRGCYDWSHDAASRYVGWWDDQLPGAVGHPGASAASGRSW